MSRNIKFAISEYYHIYNRGTEKRIVFENARDSQRFVYLLDLCNRKKSFEFRNHTNEALGEYLFEITRNENPLVSIGAYCLMPNHFHLLVKEIVEGGISKFMQKLSTAYTMYFNTRKTRNGALFQGKFKAEHLDTDPYLKYIFSYIHLNPIKLIDKDWKENGIKNKKEAMKYLNFYKYSSYLDYANDSPRLVTAILTKSNFPEYFPTSSTFDKCIDEWLNFKK